METDQTNFPHVCCLLAILIHSGAWCKNMQATVFTVAWWLFWKFSIWPSLRVWSVHSNTFNFWTVFSVCTPHFRVEVESRWEVRFPFCLAPLLPGSVMMFVLIKATLGVPPCEGLWGHSLWAASLIRPVSGVGQGREHRRQFRGKNKTLCFPERRLSEQRWQSGSLFLVIQIAGPQKSIKNDAQMSLRAQMWGNAITNKDYFLTFSANKSKLLPIKA